MRFPETTALAKLEKARQAEARDRARLRGIAHRLRRMAAMMDSAGGSAYARKLRADAEFLEKKAA